MNCCLYTDVITCRTGTVVANRKLGVVAACRVVERPWQQQLGIAVGLLAVKTTVAFMFSLVSIMVWHRFGFLGEKRKVVTTVINSSAAQKQTSAHSQMFYHKDQPVNSRVQRPRSFQVWTLNKQEQNCDTILCSSWWAFSVYHIIWPVYLQ